MTKYQLAKLVDWAGTLRTRKRLQKVVYLLQAAGCPLEADYGLHHFGPYSPDVAQLTDEMAQAGLLEETRESNGVGRQYSYRLTDRARQQLAALEENPQGRAWAEPLAGFEARARQLLRTDVRELEIAATIAYFRRQDNDWSSALEKTSRLKNLSADSPLLRTAEALARQMVA
jgi:uncharacterized protein YwgA